MGNIRAKAVCLFRQDDRVLLMQSFDPAKNEHYLMPIGGGIEFGELAIDAIQREVMEEIQQSICNLRRLHILENIFTFDAQQGHEIVFIYSADLNNISEYDLLELIAEFSEDNLKLLNRFSKKTKNIRVSEDELPNFLNIRM